MAGAQIGNLMSRGLKVADKAGDVLKSDAVKGLVQQGVGLGVDVLKAGASIFGIDLSGIDSDKVGTMAGDVFQKVATVGDGLIDKLG